MFSIIRPDINYDFMGTAPTWAKVSVGLFVLALLAIFGFPGLRLGLDFSGGHEVLVAFDQKISDADVKKALEGAGLGDTSTQRFEVPDSPKTHFLVRVQRSEVLAPETLTKVEQAFKAKYGDKLKGLTYNPEIGSVLDVEFNVDGAVATATSTQEYSAETLSGVVASTGQQVRRVRKIGRPDQATFSLILRGVDAKVVEALKPLDASADAVRVEFVGPAVGKQLRDDGILAVIYSLLLLLVYIGFRFDIYYSPGAVFAVLHDAIITIGILAVIGHQFSLTTIAAILTLTGYSINDTIVVFDRIRETVGKAQGKALADAVNKAINETLGRTVMTSSTTLLACLAMVVLGQNTVLADYGTILGVGILVGTYSSIFVASPIFVFLKERFGPKQIVGAGAHIKKADTAEAST